MNTSFERFRQWLAATALRDPIERGQASAFQIILLLTATFGLVLSLLSGFGMLGGAGLALLPFVIMAALLCAGSLLAVSLLRRGYFEAAVILSAVGLTVMHSGAVIVSQLAVPDLLLVYLLPLTLAGLLSSRRALLIVVLTAQAAVWIAALSAPPQPIGQPSLDTPSPPIFIAFNFTLLFGLSGSFFVAFGDSLRNALRLALQREHELEVLRNNLEQTVATRTADLQAALAEVETRVAEEARLRAMAEAQQVVLREMSIPVLPVSNGTLVVPLVGALDSKRLRDLQTETLTTIERLQARQLIVDITGVPVVDSQVAAGLIAVMRAARLLGVKAVLVGIRPEVAQALVGLGIDLHDLPTYSSLQAALRQG
ncbi:MAG: STAS domain-containing protein [Oscillochloridaceae bacterium umkhey_bin13]